MSAVVTTNTPQIIVEERVILNGVSWETYERIMKDHEDRSAPRFTYDDGTLEIYMPTQTHEEAAEFLKQFVYIFAGEKELDVRGLGSTTFRTKKARKGVEPDGCFYIQNANKIAGNKKVNLENDPPPDLIIEIDVTSPSLDRFPTYALFGVPEIWRYSKEKIQIFTLRRKKYVETSESICLKGVTAEVLTKFLAESRTEKRSVWLGKLLEWIHSVQ